MYLEWFDRYSAKFEGPDETRSPTQLPDRPPLSQGTLPWCRYTWPSQGTGLLRVWLLFPGVFLLLFRGSEPKWSRGNLWPRAVTLGFPFRPEQILQVNRTPPLCIIPNSTDSYNLCPPHLSQGSHRDLHVSLHIVTLQLLADMGLCIHPHPQLMTQVMLPQCPLGGSLTLGDVTQL